MMDRRRSPDAQPQIATRAERIEAGGIVLTLAVGVVVAGFVAAAVVSGAYVVWLAQGAPME